LGYNFATYVSSKAFVWNSVKIGANCFILENNVLQHGVVIEDNCFLWSGNHIGHRSIIKKSSYIASHVVISGYCTVGARSFLGVNSVCSDQIFLAEDTFLAAGAVVHADTDPAGIYIGNPAKKKEKVTSLRYFKVKSDV
jgi:acetyltransferase-like isoleucine patch superfamily enzyme